MASSSISKSAGSGSPIVFVHEFGGNHWSWEPQLNFFTRRHLCVTYAARGFPPSDVPADVALIFAGAGGRRHFRRDERRRDREGASRRTCRWAALPCSMPACAIPIAFCRSAPPAPATARRRRSRTISKASPNRLPSISRPRVRRSSARSMRRAPRASSSRRRIRAAGRCSPTVSGNIRRRALQIPCAASRCSARPSMISRRSSRR